MAVGNRYLECDTRSVASAISAASQAFTFVNLTSAGAVVPTNANTDFPFGVIQDLANRGEMCTVAVKGETKVRSGSADLAVGDIIGADSTGRAIKLTPGTSTGFYAVGRVTHVDGSDNDGALVTARIDCTVPNRNL